MKPILAIQLCLMILIVGPTALEGQSAQTHSNTQAVSSLTGGVANLADSNSSRTQPTRGVAMTFSDATSSHSTLPRIINQSSSRQSGGPLPAVRKVNPPQRDGVTAPPSVRLAGYDTIQSDSEPVIEQAIQHSVTDLSSERTWMTNPSPDPIIEIDETTQSIDLISGCSRRLRFSYKVAEVIVENPEVARVSPVSANQVIVTGAQPGVTSITFVDLERNLQTITVASKLDVRKVQMAIAQHFPTSTVRVSALATGIVLSGYVSRSDDVDSVMRVAQDFYPTNIINLLQVEGAQVVAIEVKVYEVSRTKLRSLGVDWAVLGEDLNVVSGFADLIQNFSTGVGGSPDQNLAIGVISDDTTFNAVISALEKKNVAKLLAQPTLVAQNGRPAEFLSGGEIPIQIANGLGTTSVQFRPFGTKLDFVPLIHGEGDLTLEVRAEVSEIANDLSFNTGVPAFRVRRVNTGVPMRAGQTLALAGDYNEKIDSEATGAPGLVNKPFWGIPFRKTRDARTETELVFLITPRFIDAVDASTTCLDGFGRNSTNASTHELMIEGTIEIPNCGDDCPTGVSPPFDSGQFNKTETLPAPQYPSTYAPQLIEPAGYQTPSGYFVPSPAGNSLYPPRIVR